MCLLEDRVKGVLHSLVKDESQWMKLWFRELMPHKPFDVDY